MSFARRLCLLVLLASGLLGRQRGGSVTAVEDSTKMVAPSAFNGSKAADPREVAGIQLCWCPPGRFLMGSPPGEPERRPGEDQVEVTLTRGFWMGKYEVTQGQWKRIIGKLPGELTAELPEGRDFPVGNVNFAEAEAFCRKLTELGRQSGDLPEDWEFRLPTEAQWEYACRAGTTTATSFGDQLSSQQANFNSNRSGVTTTSGFEWPLFLNSNSLALGAAQGSETGRVSSPLEMVPIRYYITLRERFARAASVRRIAGFVIKIWGTGEPNELVIVESVIS